MNNITINIHVSRSHGGLAGIQPRAEVNVEVGDDDGHPSEVRALTRLATACADLLCEGIKS